MFLSTYYIYDMISLERIGIIFMKKLTTEEFIERALKCKPYAVLFAIATVLGPGILMPGLHVNSIASTYEEAFGAVPRDKAIACTDRASLSELVVALNGYTVTSGILVGVTDGTLLTTVPIDTDLELILGYVARIGSELSELEQKFVAKLSANLEKYASRM